MISCFPRLPVSLPRCVPLPGRVSMVVLVLAGWLMAGAAAARAEDESELLGVLASDAGIPAKAEACRRLRLAGTARAVPALAGLLGEDRLSHAARYALEGMPGPEAVAALREAAGRTQGKVRSGLIDSLGWRRDAVSVPLLTEALKDADPVVASAAAAALGRIGGEPAERALEAARSGAAPAVGRAAREALLACAELRTGAGQADRAVAIYRSFLVPEEEPNLRQAAYAGWIRADRDRALPLVVSALEGGDPVLWAAALPAAGGLSEPGAGAALVALWPKAPADLRGPLLALYRERGERDALPWVMAAAAGDDRSLRPLAWSALGVLGDATSVSLLLGAAASTNATDQMAAREALEALPRGDIGAALAAEVGRRGAGVDREVFRAFGQRGETSSIPVLLTFCRGGSSSVRGLAFQALGRVMDGRNLGPLLELLLEARDEDQRGEVLGVFETLVERRGGASGLGLDPVVRALTAGDVRTRVAVLPVASLLAEDRIRASLRAALADSAEPVRKAAVQALASTRDPVLLPDLVEALRRTPDDATRSLLLEGCLRVAMDDGPVPSPAARVQALVRVLDACPGVADRRRVVAGLGHIPDRTALEAAERAGVEPAVRDEAEQAALKLAQRLGSAEFEAAERTLARLRDGAASPTVRSNAQVALVRLDSGWLCAGPFRVADRRGDQLFDVPFPPESGTGESGPWRRVPGQTDPARAGEVDLGGMTGGDHAVLYLRSRWVAPKAGEATLAIGTDDGLKLWLNGVLVHATNAVRGLVPGQERVRVALREGPNDVLAKITQHTAGCGLSLRVLDPASGAEHPGLRFESRDASAPAR